MHFMTRIILICCAFVLTSYATFDIRDRETVTVVVSEPGEERDRSSAYLSVATIAVQAILNPLAKPFKFTYMDRVPIQDCCISDCLDYDVYVVRNEKDKLCSEFLLRLRTIGMGLGNASYFRVDPGSL